MATLYEKLSATEPLGTLMGALAALGDRLTTEANEVYPNCAEVCVQYAQAALYISTSIAIAGGNAEIPKQVEELMIKFLQPETK